MGEHPDAALLDLRRAGVLGVVDEVPVQVLGDDPLGLGLHPGGDEGRQVAHGDPVEHELLADQAHGVDRPQAVLRQLVVRHVLEQEAVPVLLGQRVELVEHRHGRGRYLKGVGRKSSDQGEAPVRPSRFHLSGRRTNERT
jgi:hypothetical protein